MRSVLRTSLLLVAWLGFTEANASIDECFLISYPDLIETEHRFNERDLFIQEYPNGSNDRRIDTTSRHMALLRDRLLHSQVLKYLAAGNETDYEKTLESYEKAIEDETRAIEVVEYDIFQLYFYAHDTSFRTIDPKYVDRALVSFDKKGKAKSPIGEIFVPLVAGIRAVTQGRNETASEILSTLNSRDPSNNGLFVKTYLEYQLGVATNDIELLRQSSKDFQYLASNSELGECNRTLVGMGQYFSANAMLEVAEILDKRRQHDLSITETDILLSLHDARAHIENAKYKMDAVRYPVNWAMFHRKAAEIYHELGGNPEIRDHVKKRLKLLEDRSHLLGRLF